LAQLKFADFSSRIKAKTLSSVCNVPKDNDKDRKVFLFSLDKGDYFSNRSLVEVIISYYLYEKI